MNKPSLRHSRGQAPSDIREIKLRALFRALYGKNPRVLKRLTKRMKSDSLQNKFGDSKDTAISEQEVNAIRKVFPIHEDYLKNGQSMFGTKLKGVLDAVVPAFFLEGSEAVGERLRTLLKGKEGKFDPVEMLLKYVEYAVHDKDGATSVLNGKKALGLVPFLDLMVMLGRLEEFSVPPRHEVLGIEKPVDATMLHRHVSLYSSTELEHLPQPKDKPAATDTTAALMATPVTKPAAVAALPDPVTEKAAEATVPDAKANAVTVEEPLPPPVEGRPEEVETAPAAATNGEADLNQLTALADSHRNVFGKRASRLFESLGKTRNAFGKALKAAGLGSVSMGAMLLIGGPWNTRRMQVLVNFTGKPARFVLDWVLKDGPLEAPQDVTTPTMPPRITTGQLVSMARADLLSFNASIRHVLPLKKVFPKDLADYLIQENLMGVGYRTSYLSSLMEWNERRIEGMLAFLELDATMFFGLIGPKNQDALTDALDIATPLLKPKPPEATEPPASDEPATDPAAAEAPEPTPQEPVAEEPATPVVEPEAVAEPEAAMEAAPVEMEPVVTEETPAAKAPATVEDEETAPASVPLSSADYLPQVPPCDHTATMVPFASADVLQDEVAENAEVAMAAEAGATTAPEALVPETTAQEDVAKLKGMSDADLDAGIDDCQVAMFSLVLEKVRRKEAATRQNILAKAITGILAEL